MKPMTSDELKAHFAALPSMEPVEPEHSWRFWAWDLRQNVAKFDPAEFLTWPGIVGTMFVGNAPYIDYEYDELTPSTRKAIHEPGTGTPPLFVGATSGNLIHQAYHLKQWGGGLSELDTIIEIGGGYGAMALICHQLGFRGRYIIFDLPEFSLLQQYYLSNAGVDNVEFKTQIEEPMEADLMIGLYSLGEMPIAARDTIMGCCRAKNYLISYMSAWGGCDNTAWATGVMRRNSKHNWRHWNIPHLPNCWYLTGEEREDGT